MSVGFPLVASPEELFRQRRRLRSEKRRYLLHAPAGEAVDARTLPAKVTIITADDIKKSGAKTEQETIQLATGIVMYDQIGNSFQQTIDLRGFNGQPVPLPF